MKRAAYEEAIAGIPCCKSICYVDECGVQRHLHRFYGRAPRGKRVIAMQPGRRFKRVNVIAGKIGDRVIAPFLYEESVDHIVFEAWFRDKLCPKLAKGTIIVMDNASFHRKKELEKIAAEFECKIIWLPSYSPDKNHIEHLWANMKNWLRLHSAAFRTIQDAIVAFFQSG